MPSLDPNALLLDAIDDPERVNMPMVRKAAISVTEVLPLAERGPMQQRLVAAIQGLVDACSVAAPDDGPTQFDIGARQMQARALLREAEGVKPH